MFVGAASGATSPPTCGAEHGSSGQHEVLPRCWGQGTTTSLCLLQIKLHCWLIQEASIPTYSATLGCPRQLHSSGFSTSLKACPTFTKYTLFRNSSPDFKSSWRPWVTLSYETSGHQHSNASESA